MLVFGALVLVSIPVGALSRAGLLGSPAAAGVIGSVLGAAVALVTLAAGARVIERRAIAETGLVRRHLARDVLVGLAGGGALISTVVVVMAVAGWYLLSATGARVLSPVGLLVFAASFLAAAIVEEVVGRAVIFRILERAVGSWLAVAASAAIFGALHLLNPNATLRAAVAIALTAGVMLASVYLLTRSLWPVVGVHWGWNLFEGPVFGLPISGKPPEASLVHFVVSGPEDMTGGAFGPEASVVVIVVSLIPATVSLVLAARRGCVIAPAWARRAA